MRSFYRRLFFITGLFGLNCFISLAYANPTLKQCIHHCHTKSLNLKDFKDCKAACEKRIKKRPHKKVYHKNYAVSQQNQEVPAPVVSQVPLIMPAPQRTLPPAPVNNTTPDSQDTTPQPPTPQTSVFPSSATH